MGRVIRVIINKKCGFIGIAILLLVSLTAEVQAQSVAIEYPDDNTISSRNRLTVIARGYPGFPISLSVNGKIVSTLKVRPDNKADFLNVSVPAGPAVLKIIQELPGSMVYTDSVNVHITGPASKVFLDVNPSVIPADSVTQAEVLIRVIDEWGVPVPEGHPVTLRTDKGIILTSDLYPDQPGTQLMLSDGRASVYIVSKGQLGQANIHVETSGISAKATLNYTIPVENFMITGLASGQVGLRLERNSSNISNEKNTTELYTGGRTALFAKGTVGNGYLLTSSYDSDRRYTDRVFRYLTPERVYPIYGDASSIFYEAQTTSSLFMRIDKNQSYMQYGDYATSLSQSELSSYNRALTGISSYFAKDNISANLFGALTEQSIQVDVIQGEGVSGYYRLSSSIRGFYIIEGSERVIIQTRDRLHNDNILKEEIQYRFTDYEIDYIAGTILFKRPISSHSQDENPIFIVATYESRQALDKNVVAGGRLTYQNGNKWKIATTLIGEENQDENYWLTGIDAEVRPIKNIIFSSEAAWSRQQEEGLAWRFGIRGGMNSDFGYNFYYRDSQRTFFNPNSTATLTGVRTVRGRLSWTPITTTTIRSEIYESNNKINDEKRSSILVGGDYQWRYLTNRNSFEMLSTVRNNITKNSSILNSGITLGVSERLIFTLERDQNFGFEDINYRPNLNKLNAIWKLNEKSDFVIEHSFRDYSFVDSSYTTVGIVSPISESTNLYANYKLDGGIGGEQNQAIVGLRNNYRPADDISLNTSFERMQTLRGNRQADFYAYTIAGEYLPPHLFKSSLRFEKRNGVTLDKTVLSAAVDFILAKDISLLFKNTWLEEVRSDGLSQKTLSNNRFLSGIAYRPVKHDYINALGKYEFKSDFNDVISPKISSNTHIGSFEMIVEPFSQSEWFLRYAFKVSGLSSEGIISSTLTDLWMTSLRYEWNNRWDTLCEYRIMYQHTARDLSSGASLEIGYIIQKNIRIAAGYNFFGTHDKDFAGSANWSQGPFLRIQAKFIESDVAYALEGLQNIWSRQDQ